MRLTLRTLLAWMDGLLPEADRQEIGGKIEASPLAGRIVDRIRDVTARPALAAPRLDGRGLADDPNSVAEFLDNALPADRLEAFERVCLESDIHLAEAADCHAQLAEVARDPDAIGPPDRRLRRRLLDLASSAAAEPTPRPAQQPHRDTGAEWVTVTSDRPGRPGRSPDALDAGAQKGGTRASPAAWLSAAVALALLATLGILLAWSLLGRGERAREVAAARPPAGGDRQPAGAAEPVAEPAGGESPPASAEPAAPAPATSPVPSAVAATPAVVPTPAAATVAAGDEPADDDAGAPATAAAEPQPAAAAIDAEIPLPAMERADPEPAEEDLAADEPPAAALAAPPGTVAEGGVLLHRVGAGDEARWEALPGGGPLAATEELLVPVHAFPRIVRGGDLSIRLHPGTLAAISTDADGTPRLEIVFGAAVAWTEAADAVLGITAGGLSGVVSLGQRQELGVAVELERQPGDDPAVVAPGRRTRLHVAGGARWRQTEVDGGPPGQPLSGLDLDVPLPPRSGLEWTSSDPAAGRLLPAAEIPAWMRRAAPAGRVDRSAGRAVEEALAQARPVEESLRALGTNRRAENRMAAVATLALLGGYDELVGLLCEERRGARLSDRQWEDLQAATVPLALARGVNSAAKLREAFRARGPAGRGDELFGLALGLSPADLAAGRAAAVAELLADESLVVRRYAFADLVSLVPDEIEGRLDYHPDRAASLNERGVDWWRRRVADSQRPAP